MSIDFHLYRVPDGVSFEEWHSAHIEELDGDVGPVDPLIAEAADRIRERVLAVLPGAELNEDAEIFGFQIFGEGDGYGVDFNLHGTGADLHVSSWAGAEEFEGLILASEVLLAVAEVTGLTVYDPQCDQVLTVDMLRDEVAPAKTQGKKPAPQRAVDDRAEPLPKKRWWWPF